MNDRMTRYLLLAKEGIITCLIGHPSWKLHQRCGLIAQNLAIVVSAAFLYAVTRSPELNQALRDNVHISAVVLLILAVGGFMSVAGLIAQLTVLGWEEARARFKR